MEEGDEKFVAASYLNSYRDNSHLSFTPKTSYYREQGKKLQMLIAKSRVDCLVNIEDPAQVFSFCIHRRDSAVPVVSYIFTKPVVRRHGLAAELLKRIYDSEAGFFTHFTKYAVGFFHPRSFFYNPYLEDK